MDIKNRLLLLGCFVFALLTACEPSNQTDQPDNTQNKQQTDNDPAIYLSEPLSFDALPGWHQDKHAEAWPSLINNCKVMGKKPIWDTICTSALSTSADPASIDDQTAKQFFESYFTPYQLIGDEQKNKGLMTGYYEPLLMGSYEKTERYQHPLYAPPKSMLKIELGDLYPELKNKRVRGQLVGNKVIPYFDRETIDGETSPIAGEEILWVDSKIDVFFLHIQGSGRVQLPDGKIIGVGYANQNGQPYRSIGQVLIDNGGLDRKNVNLFTIKDWLRTHPEEADAVLNSNPSYVFFNIREEVKQGPIGSLNVPLTPERSIAIDPRVVSLGSLMYVDSTYPDEKETPLQKLVFAQDTGGAIKGQLRADMFYGTGKQAEYWAGLMKQYGQYFLLKPNE